MRWILGATTVALLLTIMAILPAARVFALCNMSPIHSATCHRHAPSNHPRPHDCCLDGNHAAIPGPAMSSTPASAHCVVLYKFEEFSTPSASSIAPAELIATFSGPPAASPLRI